MYSVAGFHIRYKRNKYVKVLDLRCRLCSADVQTREMYLSQCKTVNGPQQFYNRMHKYYKGWNASQKYLWKKNQQQKTAQV